MGIHDAVAGADDGLGIQLIGSANARPEVPVVVLNGRVAVACACASSREVQGAIDAGYRVGKIGIKEAGVVLDFLDAGEIIQAQAEVKSQLGADLPVVLNIGRDSAEARSVARMQGIIRKAALVDLADEEAGVGHTGAGRGCIAGSTG